MANGSPLTTAQEVAAVLKSPSAVISGRGVLVPFSARVPGFILANLDAMAAKSGKSRNSLVALVLLAGLEAIGSHLDDATKEELVSLRSDAYGDLPAGQDGEAF